MEKIKKIIAVVCCISIISAMLVISCFASVVNLQGGKYYILDQECFDNTSNAITQEIQRTGTLKYNDTEFEFRKIKFITNNDKTSYSAIYIYATAGDTNPLISIIQVADYNIYIKFNSINSDLNSYSYLFNEVPKTIYDNTGEILSSTLGYLSDIVSYMTTNTITLICIMVVIVSLGVGFLIRIIRVQ